MSVTSYIALEKQIKQSSKKCRAALVAPSDITTLQACLQASEQNLIDLLVIGDEELLSKKSEASSLDISGIEILDFVEPYKAVEMASKLACAGEVDLIMKGKYHPADFIEKLFHSNSEFCDLQQVYHIAVCKTKEYDKFLFLTDGMIHCQPNVTTKSQMIQSTVNFANKFGLTLPKVALLAAVEVVYKQMPATVDADFLQQQFAEDKSAVVEGPLSFDIAIDLHAAQAKGLVDSKVAGQVDILVAPNIETAGGVYKALSLFSDSEIGSVIVGGAVPVVVPIEIDSVKTRYNSILLSLLATSQSS